MQAAPNLQCPVLAKKSQRGAPGRLGKEAAAASGMVLCFLGGEECRPSCTGLDHVCIDMCSCIEGAQSACAGFRAATVSAGAVRPLRSRIGLPQNPRL